MNVEAEVVLDSINAFTGDRMTTILVTFPRPVLAEVVTHRILFMDDTNDAALVREAYDLEIPHPTSRNTASSRAIPIRRMLERVTADPFIPDFRQGQKGMTSGPPVDGVTQALAEDAWREMMAACRQGVQRLLDLGIEKGQANRPLEWFSYVEMLISGTEWNNFFLLRCHEAAQGEMRATAEAMRAAVGRSIPQVLQPGEWHLPFIKAGDVDQGDLAALMEAAKVSSARCARLSYRSLVTGVTSEVPEDIALFLRLADGNPKHLSPTEHQAEAMFSHERWGNLAGFRSLRKGLFEGVEAGGDFVT